MAQAEDENWPNGYTFNVTRDIANYISHNPQGVLIPPPAEHSGPLLLAPGALGTILHSLWDETVTPKRLKWVYVKTYPEEKFGYLYKLSIPHIAISSHKAGKWTVACADLGKNPLTTTAKNANQLLASGVRELLLHKAQGSEEDFVWTGTEATFPEVGRVRNFLRATPCNANPASTSENEGGDAQYNTILCVDGFDIATKTGATPMILTSPLPPLGPPTGVPVDVAFELVVDGKRHPNSYARLPTIGPFRDWALANSVAVKISWADEQGKRRSTSLQKTHNQSQYPNSTV